MRINRVITKFVDVVLANPFLFELQQRLCNDYESVFEEFRHHLEVSGKTILDVGCSVGTCSGQIIDMRNNTFYGVDIEPRYVRIASERYPDGHFRVMDARSLDFEPESFDVVLVNGVLHHMADDLIRDCFKEVHRVVRRQGVVLVAEPVFTPGRRMSNLLLSLDRGRHIRTTEGYQELFDGFRIVRQSYFQLSLHRLCSFVLEKDVGPTLQSAD